MCACMCVFLFIWVKIGILHLDGNECEMSTYLTWHKWLNGSPEPLFTEHTFSENYSNSVWLMSAQH